MKTKSNLKISSSEFSRRQFLGRDAKGITATALVVVLFWACSPVLTLLSLTVLYGAAGVYLYRQLTVRLRDAHTLAATLEQLRKDRACLEKALE